MAHNREGYDADDDAIDLRPYIVALWRRKVTIAAVTVVCGLAAFVISLRTPPVYEARTQMIVMRSASADQATMAAAIATFRALLDNQEVAAQVVRELRLDLPPFGLSAAGFLAGNVTAQSVGATNVISVSVRLPEPTMAAKAANRYTSKAIDLSARVDRDDMRVLEQQLGRAKERFEQIAATLARSEGKTGLTRRALRLDGRQILLDAYSADDPALAATYAEYNAVQIVYTEIVIRYERARVQMATRSGQFQIVETAVPPASPIAPRPRRTAVVAMIVAFLVSAGVVILLQLVALSRARPAARGQRPPTV